MAGLIVSSLKEPFIPSLIAISIPTLSFHQSRAEPFCNKLDMVERCGTVAVRILWTGC